MFVGVSLLAAVLATVAGPLLEGATEYPGFSIKGGKCFPAESQVWVKKDKERAFIGVRTVLPPRGLLRRVAKGAPGNAARIDDCVLLKFADGRLLAINANGAISAKGEIPPSLACKSTVTEKTWDFTCSLALAEMGDLKGFDVGRHWALAKKGYQANTFIGMSGSLFDRKGLVWMERPDYTESPFEDDVSATASVDFKFAYYPSFNKFRGFADVTLMPKWESAAKAIEFAILDDKGESVFARTLPVNGKGVADEIFDIPDLRPLTVASGNPRYTACFRVAGFKGADYRKHFYRHAMDWEGNRYGLSEIVVPPFTAMAVSGMDVTTVLRKHRLNGLGLFEQVWAPAKEGATEPTRAILAEGGVRLLATVKGREFPLRGELTFTDGASPVKRTFQALFDDHGLQGRVDGIFEYDGQLDWRLTLEKGSLEKLRLVAALRDDEAMLMHAIVDTTCHNYAGKIKPGTGRVWDSTEAKWRAKIIGDYLPYVWLGGPLRGLSVYGENDKGWEIGGRNKEEGRGTSEEGGEPCYEIIREPGVVKLQLNLIQRPIEIKTPRTIRLGFMATPVKPMLENWRNRPHGQLFGGGMQWGAAPQDADVCPFDGTDEFWKRLYKTRETRVVDKEYLADAVSRVPYPGKPGSAEYLARYNTVKSHFESGFNLISRCTIGDPKKETVWYTNARGVDYGIPSGTTYCDEWNIWEFMDMDRDFNRMSKRDYCLDPVPSFRDFAAWWYRKMALSGACDHLYWDVVQPKGNFDPIGTDAYRMEDGRVQPSCGIFNMRELIKRCATVQAEVNKDPCGNWIHMTNTAMAPVSAFAGVHFDWEDDTAPQAFQEKYPKDYLQAAVIGRQFGNRVQVMGLYAKSTPERNEFYERTGAGMMLAHELMWKWNARHLNHAYELLEQWGYRTPSVRVWNYWNRDEPYPLEISGPEQASLLMVKSDGTARIVISDFSGKGGAFRVKMDCAALKVPVLFKAFNVETGEALEVQGGVIVCELKPFDFIIIGVDK